MKQNANRRAARTGFTLVEMLVATALILFILLILTTIFSTGIGALRNLRGVNSLQTQLRTASTIMRRDLSAPHFAREITSLSGPDLSQQRLDMYDWQPPKEGFFRIWQGQASTPEGTDNDSIGSYKMDTNTFNFDYLHFTVRLEPNSAQGSGRDRYFSSTALDGLVKAGLLSNAKPNATTPSPYERVMKLSRPSYLGFDAGNTLETPMNVSGTSEFRTSWAEVAYFVSNNGLETPNRDKLFSLHRRRLLLVDNRLKEEVASQMALDSAAANRLSDFSLSPHPTQPGRLVINTPSDVTNPQRRYGAMQTSLTSIQPSFAGILDRANHSNNTRNSFKTLYDVPATGETATSMSIGGDDILLDNVLSFEVKALWEVPSDLRMVPASGLGSTKPGIKAVYVSPTAYGANSDFPFDDLPVGSRDYGNRALFDYQNPGANQVRVFDTWCGEGPFAGVWNKFFDTPNTPAARGSDPDFTNETKQSMAIPMRIRVRAVQIRLRVWDAKTEQARQVTIVQDL